MPTAIPNTLWPQGPNKGNLIRGSNQFHDTRYWTPQNGGGGSVPVLTQNYGIAPDGTQTACRFQATKSPSTGNSLVYQVPGNVFELGKQYWVSVWAKSLQDNPCVVKIYVYKNFPTAYTIGGIDAALTQEWKRYIFPMIAGAPFKVAEPGVQYTFNFGIVSGTTSDAADCLIWGYQVIEGTEPGAYVETQSLQIPPEPQGGNNIPKEASSNPDIYALQGTTFAPLETSELYTSEASPKFGWNVGVPPSGYWKIGDLLSEKTPNNPQLRICSVEGNPGTWRTLLHAMGQLTEVYDFNSLDDLDGWGYLLASAISGPFLQPLTTAQVTVANSKLNQIPPGWLFMVHPVSQGFTDGVFQINCRPGTPSGIVLRAGTTAQGVLVNFGDSGNGYWSLRGWQHGAGDWSATAQILNTPQLDNTKFYTWTYILSGNSITIYVDDMLIGTMTDATFNTGGTRCGWRQNGNYQQFVCWVRIIPLAGIPWNEI